MVLFSMNLLNARDSKITLYLLIVDFDWRVIGYHGWTEFCYVFMELDWSECLGHSDIWTSLNGVTVTSTHEKNKKVTMGRFSMTAYIMEKFPCFANSQQPTATATNAPPSNSPVTLLQEHVNPDITFSLISLHILLFVTRMQLSSWLFKSFIAGNYSYQGMKTIVKVKNKKST